ncbi:putative head protein [Aeromonas phage Gekk3-15]
MFPGSDLLSDALELIDPKEIQFRRFLSRSLNSIGIYESQFEPDVTVEACVQAVPRTLYKQFNLDWQKNYLSVYISRSVLDLQRDSAGDRFVIDNRLYQAVSEVPWFEIDGWVNIAVCEITPIGP